MLENGVKKAIVTTPSSPVMLGFQSDSSPRLMSFHWQYFQQTSFK
jgi:hypothetical protein